MEGLSKYNIGGVQGPTTELHSISTPSSVGAEQARLLSLHNPLTVFAVLLAVSGGFMAFGTSGRVGPVSAAVKVGK